jgi:L-lactate dehydrogenase complex protein LldG
MLMPDARTAIMQRVRRATQRERGDLPPALHRERTRDGVRATFRTELEAVAGRVHACAQASALTATIAAIPAVREARRGVAWDTPRLRAIVAGPVLGAIGWTFPPAAETAAAAWTAWREAAAQAEVGLTEADYALADTGTLVVLARPGQPRLASLLPPVHVALLDAARILPHLDALLAELEADRTRLTSCLTLITGPSRTADIEKKIVLGAHGPKELHVVLYE